MDAELLDQSLSFHGSALMQQLADEHGESLSVPAALRRRYAAPDSPAKDRWTPEDKNDADFVAAVQKFIARKADMLFCRTDKKSAPSESVEADQPEDVFGIMPPVESFMGFPPGICQQHFYESLSTGDIVVGVVSSVSDSGVIATLLCTDTPGVHRDIDELNISCFCPAKELPRMFAHQSLSEAYQPRDVFRGIVLAVNPEKKRIFVSLRDRSKDDKNTKKEDCPKIGLISKDDFPVHYRRKMQRCGLTFSELLQSVLGFTNKGSVDALQTSLALSNSASLMRGLHNVKVPVEEYAERLRKWQTNRQAHSSVVQGVEMVKQGRQLEAIQHLNMALKIDPTHTEALVARGAVYANNACYLKAIEDFETALEADPKHVNAKKYLVETKLVYARRYEEQGDIEEALENYREILKTDPFSVEAKQGMERCRSLQGEEVKAKGHNSAEPVSVSSSDEGESSLQKSADKLKRLMQADKKDSRKKRRSEDSQPGSSKKSKRKKERKKSKQRSESSSSSPPCPPSPHAELNQLWEEWQSLQSNPPSLERSKVKVHRSSPSPLPAKLHRSLSRDSRRRSREGSRGKDRRCDSSPSSTKGHRSRSRDRRSQDRQYSRSSSPQSLRWKHSRERQRSRSSSGSSRSKSGSSLSRSRSGSQSRNVNIRVQNQDNRDILSNAANKWDDLSTYIGVSSKQLDQVIVGLRGQKNREHGQRGRSGEQSESSGSSDTTPYRRMGKVKHRNSRQRSDSRDRGVRREFRNHGTSRERSDIGDHGLSRERGVSREQRNSRDMRVSREGRDSRDCQRSRERRDSRGRQRSRELSRDRQRSRERRDSRDCQRSRELSRDRQRSRERRDSRFLGMSRERRDHRDRGLSRDRGDRGVSRERRDYMDRGQSKERGDHGVSRERRDHMDDGLSREQGDWGVSRERRDSKDYGLSREQRDSWNCGVGKHLDSREHMFGRDLGDSRDPQVRRDLQDSKESRRRRESAGSRERPNSTEHGDSRECSKIRVFENSRDSLGKQGDQDSLSEHQKRSWKDFRKEEHTDPKVQLVQNIEDRIEKVRKRTQPDCRALKGTGDTEGTNRDERGKSTTGFKDDDIKEKYISQKKPKDEDNDAFRKETDEIDVRRKERSGLKRGQERIGEQVEKGGDLGAERLANRGDTIGCKVDTKIISRQGTLTVVSKWDSPTRQSRWDTSQGDAKNATHTQLPLNQKGNPDTQLEMSEWDLKNQVHKEDSGRNRSPFLPRQLRPEVNSKWSGEEVPSKWSTDEASSRQSQNESLTGKDGTKESGKSRLDEKHSQKQSYCEGEDVEQAVEKLEAGRRAKAVKEERHGEPKDDPLQHLSIHDLEQRLYQQIAVHFSAASSTTSDDSSHPQHPPQTMEGPRSPDSTVRSEDRRSNRENDSTQYDPDSRGSDRGTAVAKPFVSEFSESHRRSGCSKQDEVESRVAPWKQGETSVDSYPCRQMDRKAVRDDDTERGRSDRKYVRDASPEAETSWSHAQQMRRNKLSDREQYSSREVQRRYRDTPPEEVSASSWMEKIISNVDVMPSAKPIPGDADIKLLIRTSATASSPSSRLLIAENVVSSTSRKKRKFRSSSSSSGRESSRSKKKRSSSRQMSSKDKSKQKKKRRHRSSSSSSPSSSNDRHRKKKRSSSQRGKKNEKKRKSLKRSKRRSPSSSSSSSSSPSPERKRRRSSQRGKVSSSDRQGLGPEFYGPVKPSPSVMAATASTLPQKVVAQPHVAQPVNAELNELENFLKELKTKKKEQLVAGGIGKKD